MRTRRRGLTALIFLLAAAVIIGAVVLLGRSSAEDPDETSAFDPSVPTSTQTPPPAGPASPTDDPTDDPSDPPTDGSDPTDDPSAPSSPTAPSPLSEDQKAEISSETSPVLTEVLEETAEIDPAVPYDVVADLSDRASQAYLSELQSERLEFETEGWTRTGSYTLDEIEVTDYSSTGDTEVATVQVCVDSSELITRRADGEVLTTAPSSERAWNVFVLERSGSADWRIVGRTFPNDQAC